MPLPTPTQDETQAAFMARCMPVVADDAAYETQDQKVAACLEQFRSHAKNVKVLDEKQGLLGGWGIPFGGPVIDPNHAAGKDLDGEYFDQETNFCLDWFPEDGRPVMYDHGTDPEVKLTPVGRQVAKFTDPKMGVWVETQLNMAGKYAEYIMELAKKGVLGFSSGALGGYVRREKNGKITQWPWIEQTVTVRPANPYALIAQDAVKHLRDVGIELPGTAPAVPEPPATLAEALKDAPSNKKLVLPDGMSFNAFRTEMEESIKQVPGVECGWFVDAVDNTAVFNVGDGYYRYGFSIGTDGKVTVDPKTGVEVEMQTTWEPEDEGKRVRELATKLDHDGWTKQRMSARSMGQLHQAIKVQHDLHATVCEMGDDCPLYEGQSTKQQREEPLTPEREELEAFLANVRLERGARHA